MKAFVALCKVELISLLHALNFIGKKKKKPFAAPIAALIGIALMAYISITYSLPMASIMIPLNLDMLYWAQMVLMTLILCLSFTFLASSSMLFSGKDMDFLFALPLSSRAILFCKLIALYLENLFLTAGMLIPSACVYGYHTSVSAPFAITVLITCLTVPLLSTTISAVVGFVVTAISSHLKFKKLFSVVLGAISMVVLFKIVFSWQFSLADPTQLVSMPDKLWSYFLPLKWISASLAYQAPVKILPFVLLCVLCLSIFLFAFAPFYQKIVLRFASHSVKSNFKMKHQVSGSCVSALLKKEAYRFFGTPIYLFNSGTGCLMLILAGGYLLFNPSYVQDMVATTHWSYDTIALILSLVSAFLILLSPTSTVNISLENKSLWLLQSSPVLSSTILLIKALFNCLVFFPGIVVFFIGCQFALQLPLPIFLLCLVANLLCLVFGSLLGVVVNLHLPRLDAANDTIVVKQSGSVLVTMLIDFAFLGILAGIKFLFALSSLNVLILAMTLLAVLSIALYYYIKKRGSILFTSLTEQ